MRKMYVIFVILLAKTIVSAGDSSDETKYIDLLPDKEKEDFLERIARRIFNGVQSKDDRDAVSGEVSDAQLDENEEYVKQILKEESLNMRKNGVGVDSKITDINRKQLKEDDNVKDEYSNKKDADDANLVDLTFRDSKRNKRNSLAKINEDSKIINLNVGNGGPGEENDSLNMPLATDEDKSDVKDIQIKSFRRNTSSYTNAIEVATGNSHVTKMIDVDPEIEDKHSEEAVQKNSKELVKTPESDDVSPRDISQPQEPEELPNDKESNEYSKFGSTQKIFESLENNDSKDREKKDTVLDANTTTSESTNPEVKVPVETITDKILDKNSSSEDQQSINPNAHTRKLYNVDVDTENKKPKIKDISNENTPNYSQETRGTLVSVAIVNDLATQTNFNKETPAINLEKVNSEMTAIETMTLSNFTNTEHTTEKNEDGVTNTLKTESLTVTPLKTDEKLHEENELKDLKEEKITNLEPPTKETNDIKGTSSKELIGADLNNNVPKNVDNNKKNEVNSNQDKEKDVNQVKVDKEVYDLTNDMIKALRTEIRPATDSQENNLRGLRALYEATKPNEYKVYAVPESKQPFVKKEQETGNKENPYYVPIYNYSPDHAYYNPNNRLGSNADDADEKIVEYISENEREDIDLNKRDRDEDDNTKPLGSDELVRASDKDRDKDVDDLVRGYNNYKKTRKFRFGDGKKTIDKVKPYKLNLPVVVQYPKFTDIILNSHDYSDIDYFYGRSLNKPMKRMRCELDKKKSNVFPSSSEEDHPYNNMQAEHNLKDHMRAVRQLLYRQKYFGYIPELNTTVSAESKGISNETKYVLRSKPSKTKPSDQTSKENIAMDYFFGRMNEDVDTESEKLDSKHTLSTEYHQDRTKAVDNANKNERIRVPNRYKNINNEIKPATTYKDVSKDRKKPVLRAKTTKKPLIDFATINEVLSIADESDLLPTLDKLIKLNLTTRSNDGVNLEPFLTVLEDMVKNDAKALKQYDWLQTTVDIQAALVKLMDLSNELRNNITLSQPDLQLLKYTIYLHKSAKAAQVKDFRKKKRLLPRNRKQKKGIITQSGLLDRQWLYRMLPVNHDKVITKRDLREFHEFLNNLQYYLYDLHTAVQHIADITKFNTQRWFQNLKELYLDTKVKSLLEVLLHLSTARLLDLVEESAKNGVEDDFLTYVMKNEKEVQRAKQELSFVLQIIEELRF